MVDIKAVKLLRSQSGAALSDCVEALEAADGNAAVALETLKADNRYDGKLKDQSVLACLVAVASTDDRAAIVELAADGIGALEQQPFKAATSYAAEIALDYGDEPEALLAAPAPDGEGLFSDYLDRISSVIGHRIAFRRIKSLAVEQGVVSSHISVVSAQNTGSLGVIVALECAKQPGELSVFAEHLAKHIMAAAPLWVSEADIPKSVRLSKRWLLTEEAGNEEQLSPIMQREIDGRLRDFYKEVVLLRQSLGSEGGKSVSQALRQVEAMIGAPVRIAGFARFQAGESIGDAAGTALAGDLEWSFGNAWAEEVPNAVFELYGHQIFEAQATGPALRNDRDAVDLLNTAWNHGASVIIVPVSRLPDNFLPLETRVAGPILQKFATFGTQVVFLGDVREAVAQSSALQAFIVETNSRDDIWFLPDKDALAERLARSQKSK